MENKSFVIIILFIELTVVLGLSTWTFATISKDLANKTMVQENLIKDQKEHIKQLELRIKELTKGE